MEIGIILYGACLISMGIAIEQKNIWLLLIFFLESIFVAASFDIKAMLPMHF